jgi:two-component system phosphate regulon response regulator PhoB
MSEQITILVVEDEAHIRRVLDYNLKLDGFEVYLAEDGAAGLKLARENRPDVILLDWLMPVMNGLQVLAELKADSTYPRLYAYRQRYAERCHAGDRDGRR